MNFNLIEAKSVIDKYCDYILGSSKQIWKYHFSVEKNQPIA